MALTREELAQQTLAAARQAVEDLRNGTRGTTLEYAIRRYADRIDEAITGLSDFLPLPNAPLPIPPVEVPDGAE